MINPALLPLTLPDGTQFPGTPQKLLTLIARYMQVTGLSSFNGINYGPTTPAEDSRTMPWFRTDGSYNPISWNTWNGSQWTPLALVTPSGTTGERPSSAAIAQQYYDTDINALIIWSSTGAWTTASGSPGDVKYVKAVSSTVALTNNPGWVIDTDGNNMVVASADDTHHLFGTTIGEETHLLVAAEMPKHGHKYSASNWAQSGFTNNNPPTGCMPFGGAAENLVVEGPGISETPDTTAGNQIGSAGGDTAHNNMQPTIYYWRMVKSF
jgi:microcystin-dependent protein